MVAWVDLPPSAGFVVRVDQTPIPVTTSLVDGGTQLRFDIPSSASSLSIEHAGGPILARAVHWQRQPLENPFVIWALGKRVPTSVLLYFLEAAALARTGYGRLQVQRLRQKLLFQTRQLERSREALETTLAHALTLDARHDAAEIAAALAYQHTVALDFSSARSVLSRHEPLRAASPEAALHADLRDAELATAVFDLAGAIAANERALRLTRRLGDEAEALNVENQIIMLISELGLRDEAIARIEQGQRALDRLELPCRSKAVLQGNLGWARLRLAARGLLPDVPHEEFERALDAVTRTCPDRAEAANQTANLALAALLDGDINESQQRLLELEALDPPPSLHPFVEDLSREVRLADPSWDAPALLTQDPVAARGTGWERWNQHARELRSWGLHDAAIEAFERAEDELDIASATLPIAIGHANYVGSRTSSLRGLLELRLEQGHTERALCAV